MRPKKKEEGIEQPVTVEREIIRIKSGTDCKEKVKDEVVVEDQIELYVNDNCYAIFSCSPYEIKELVVGYLLTEGTIRRTEEITSTDISKGRARVHLAKKANLSPRKPQLILTSCVSGTLKIPPHLLMKVTKNDPSFRLSRQTIFGAVKLLNSKASVFRRTGGTHASALLDEKGRVLAFSEDIGRHNAIDKVAGKIALEHESFRRRLLASTGRLTFEMVIKAATVGIPVMVSMSAPTDKAIRAAEMFGLTLIGFARGRRFNIYTCPERIIT